MACKWRLMLFLGMLLCLDAQAQRFQLSTNAGTWARLGTLNAQFEYGCARNWTVGISGRYNPFTYNRGERDQMQMRQRSAALGARWWPWHIFSGWWLGTDLRWQEYNVGGLAERPRTEEGWRVGAGLNAGYSYMISPHFNVEFGLGFWAGGKKYAVYACPECGRTLESGSKAFLLPDDLIIAFTYVF